MKLYIYEHCPYCNRVRAFLGIKKLALELVVLASDDVDTPTKMVGQKIAPILKKNDGSYLTESLDIINYLDHLNSPIILSEQPKKPAIGQFISAVMPSVYRLAMPRWVSLPLKEFAEKSARDYFVYKKSQSIGPFETAIMDTEQYENQALALMQQHLEPILDAQFISGTFSLDDIILLPILQALTADSRFPWPPQTLRYLDFMLIETHLKKY